MKPATFLGGRVLKFSLPTVQAPPGPDTPRLKRLQLPQGELAQFYDGEEGIRYLATVELRAGTIRGNHYHKFKPEWLYMISGAILLVVEDPASKDRGAIPLEAGDMAYVPTGIAHAFRTAQPGLAIEFSSARFDPKDSYSHTVL